MGRTRVGIALLSLTLLCGCATAASHPSDSDLALYDRGRTSESEGRAADAVEDLTEAGSRGFVPAMVELSRLYASRARADASRPALMSAIAWETRAAERGDYASQAGLAHLFSSGSLVREDDVKAYTWWSVAASDAPAGQAAEIRTVELPALARRMSQAQLAEARSISSAAIAAIEGQKR